MNNLSFLSVSEFKTLLGSDEPIKFKITNNNKKVALFKGKLYKCAGDLNIKEPVSFLIEDGNIDEGCFINPKNSWEDLGTL